MKFSISNLLHRLLATRTVRVEKSTPWVLYDEDALRADGVSERDIELLREGIVRAPSPDEAIIRQAWEDTRPTPADQAVIDALRAAPLPEITPEMRDRAIARFAEKFPNNPVADPVATTEEFAAQVAGFRRAYLGDWATPTDAQLEQVRDGLAADTETAAPAPERPATVADVEPPRRPVLSEGQLQAARDRVFAGLVPPATRPLPWPPVPMRYDSRPLMPLQQSDYQPTTPPPAPLPRGTGSGPGFARTLERIDDVIAQEVAAKRYFDGLGDE